MVVIKKIKFTHDLTKNVTCDCKGTRTKEKEFCDDLSQLTPNCMWAVDFKGNFTFLSGSIENIFGNSDYNYLNQSVFDSFETIDGVSLHRCFEASLADPCRIDEFQLSRRHSSEKILISALPFYDENKKLLGFRGIAQNITKLLEIENQMRESNKALQNKNIALNELLSRVESEKTQIYTTIAANIEKFIKPLLRSLQGGSNLSTTQEKTISTIEQLLNELNWDFYRQDENLAMALTPTERQLCRLIRSSYSVKEIADVQSISVETAKTHCKNIRKKLGLTNQKVTLASFFQQG